MLTHNEAIFLIENRIKTLSTDKSGSFYIAGLLDGYLASLVVLRSVKTDEKQH